MSEDTQETSGQRWKIKIEYFGRDFCGWQKQPEVISVQSVLEEALYKISGETIKTIAAGRTDSGVHALGQVVHFDMIKTIKPQRILYGLNYHLKQYDVAVLSAEAVEPDFHARFSAKERSYIYRILCRPACPVVDKGRVWWIKHQLNMDAMQEAANVLIGEHDFTSFRASLCQSKSPVKTIDEITFSRKEVINGGYEIVMFVKARSFLHHQVRNIIGTLKLVGEGKWTAEDVRSALEAKTRCKAGPTAPPEGLYFLEVFY